MSLFNSIRIRTPESVELEFALAGIGSRAVALTIDYVVLGAGLLLLFGLGVLVLVQLSQVEALLFIETETLRLWAVAILSLILFACYVGYFVGFETWWHGQTPGKRYAHIRVIRDDAQPTRLFQATLRSLVRPVDDILFLGFFCILLGKREKRIGDWLAGTLVVQTDPRPTSTGLTVSEQAKIISTDLLNLIDFECISPDDFAIVREYLPRRPMLTQKARKEVSLQLASRIREKIGLRSLPTEMTTDTFLEAIYWAYQKQR